MLHKLRHYRVTMSFQHTSFLNARVFYLTLCEEGDPKPLEYELRPHLNLGGADVNSILSDNATMVCSKKAVHNTANSML